MEQHDQTTTTRRTWRRLLAIAGLLFALFLTYRIFAVYTVRSGECRYYAARVPMTARAQANTSNGRVVFFPKRTPAEEQAPHLVVMTYNIAGHAKLWRPSQIEQIAATINKVKPDVVGLQEVHVRTWQSEFHDQARELAKLTGMNVEFGRSFSALGGEFGNAVMTRGKVTHAVTHNLPSLGEPRSALGCTIDLDGRRFEFFVTHLTTWGRFHRASRQEQIDCLVEMMRRTRLPYILVGDFNATPDTPEIASLLNNRELHLCNDPAQPTHTFTQQHLDYVFADYGWRVVASRVVHEGPSDHWPVVAELAWTPEVPK